MLVSVGLLALDARDESPERGYNRNLKKVEPKTKRNPKSKPNRKSNRKSNRKPNRKPNADPGMNFFIPRLQGSLGLPALGPGEQSPAIGQAGGSGAAATTSSGGKINATFGEGMEGGGERGVGAEGREAGAVCSHWPSRQQRSSKLRRLF